jgi:hypothetical protein
MAEISLHSSGMLQIVNKWFVCDILKKQSQSKNISNKLPTDTAQHPRRLMTLTTPWQEPKISHQWMKANNLLYGQ